MFVWLIWVAVSASAQVEPILVYKKAHTTECQSWVDSICSRMTLREKVGQLFVYTIAPQTQPANMALLRDAVVNKKVGGLLFSGGQVYNQVTMTNQAQKWSPVPLMITFDGEWGLAMRLKNTPQYPRNQILGCITDEKLLYAYGREVGRQCHEIGVQVNFAPDADVNINPRNPVIGTRSFGENPRNVADKVVSYASGLESMGVLSVCKHFPGHGDTSVDSHKALPLLDFSRSRLDSIELVPFRRAIQSGLGGVMVGHLQVPSLDTSKMPASLSCHIIHDLLCQELAFKGLVFTDALAMKGVARYKNVCALALMAGNDIVLAPPSLAKEIDGVMDAIKKGKIKESEIDRKCRKVLTYKYVLGLSRTPEIQLNGLENRINTKYAVNLISALRRASVTVLGNDHKLLPWGVSSDKTMLLTVGSSHATFRQSMLTFARQTVTRNLTLGMDEASIRKLASEMQSYERILVCVTDDHPSKYASILSALPQKSNTAYVFFVPMKSVTGLDAVLKDAGAVIMAHAVQGDLQRHVADVIYGKAKANGRLSMAVGKLFKPGDGVLVAPPVRRFDLFQPEEVGMDPLVLKQIDSIARRGIAEEAFPGCQILISKDGKVVYDRFFGSHTYSNEQPVTKSDLYDLASLSKTTGTLLAVMKLYDDGKLKLEGKVGQYLSLFRGTDKGNITVRQLLTHESGLPAALPFFRDIIDSKSYKGKFYSNKRNASHPVQIDVNYFVPKFKYLPEYVSTTYSEEYPYQVADSFYVSQSFRKLAMEKIIKTKLLSRSYRYSCVNFILLKEIVEKLSGTTMDDYLNEKFFEPMKLQRMAYLPLTRFPKNEIIPTVSSGLLHHGIVQGYVQDEAAAILGNVSGNAGLFANAEDVSVVYQMLLNGGEYEGTRYLKQRTCDDFTQYSSSHSRRGLGFDKPSPNNDHKPCSLSTPLATYGHTGFTGTCAWADPVNQIVYVFLSNRTWPHPWNHKRLMGMKIRENIQEIIYKSLISKGQDVDMNKPVSDGWVEDSAEEE